MSRAAPPFCGWLPALAICAGCSGFTPAEGDASLSDGEPVDRGVVADLAAGDLAAGDLAATGDLAADRGPTPDVDCGAASARSARRTVAGEVKESCQGCDCRDWKVYDCYPEQAVYGGEPYADLVWQVGYEVLRFAVTPSGEVFVVGHGPDKEIVSAAVTVHALVPGATCEVDVEIDVEVDVTDGMDKVARWVLHGRAVGTGY